MTGSTVRNTPLASPSTRQATSRPSVRSSLAMAKRLPMLSKA